MIVSLCKLQLAQGIQWLQNLLPLKSVPSSSFDPKSLRLGEAAEIPQAQPEEKRAREERRPKFDLDRKAKNQKPFRKETEVPSSLPPKPVQRDWFPKRKAKLDPFRQLKPEDNRSQNPSIDRNRDESARNPSPIAKHHLAEFAASQFRQSKPRKNQNEKAEKNDSPFGEFLDDSQTKDANSRQQIHKLHPVKPSPKTNQGNIREANFGESRRKTGNEPSIKTQEREVPIQRSAGYPKLRGGKFIPGKRIVHLDLKVGNFSSHSFLTRIGCASRVLSWNPFGRIFQ